MSADAEFRNQLLPIFETKVVPEWLDYNGHMNDAAYAIVFSRSVDGLMERVGLDAAARKATGRTLFTLQMMLHYIREAKLGDPLSVGVHLIEHDEKRMRVWLDMWIGPDGPTICSSEQLLLSVDNSGEHARAAPWREETFSALQALRAAQATIEPNKLAGQGIRLKRV